MKMNMNKVALATVIAIGSVGASAEQVLRIPVTGSVTPVACNMSILGGEPAFNLGQLTFAQLESGANIDLGIGHYAEFVPPAKTINIACSAPAMVKLTVADDRVSSSIDTANYYGLGTSNGIGNGVYQLYATNPVIDGIPSLFMAKSLDGGTTWDAPVFPGGNGVQMAIWEPGTSLSFTTTSASKTPVAFTNASIELTIAAFVNKALSGGDAVKFDGASVITLTYL